MAMLGVHQAVAELNATELTARLASAIQQGRTEEDLEDAQAMLDNLQREKSLKANLSQYTELVAQDSPDARPLTCLTNLLSQAKRFQVAEDEVQAAQPAIQAGARRRNVPRTPR